jgi:hypothetical protein
MADIRATARKSRRARASPRLAAEATPVHLVAEAATAVAAPLTSRMGPAPAQAA